MSRIFRINFSAEKFRCSSEISSTVFRSSLKEQTWTESFSRNSGLSSDAKYELRKLESQLDDPETKLCIIKGPTL